MKIVVCESYEEMSRKGAEVIAELLKNKPTCVLGLATGSTPVGMYKELAAMNKSGEITFRDVTSYNLDEYYPLAPDHDQSYRYFMNTNLFNHIDIDKARTNVPDGLAEDPAAMGAAYDAAIEAAGGIDLQVLGLGPNGHIAFNEPEDELYVGTHLTGLTESTIKANSRFFASEEDVPKQAVTMGLGSIMKAKQILVLASGKAKHAIIQKMMGGRITTQVPSTLLLTHPNVILICDKEAYEG
ncbi:MAG: glucosamine-6-phosphate deaminase [Ruminococcaceae bacterium]|nr:glucosamine-6-phosphate deaminase [Oscillospiraceae bacterium]